jgi:hypothetical protein
MDATKVLEKNIKNISAIDWLFVEIVSILFGIGLVAIFPEEFGLIGWYWWLVVALLFAMPMLQLIYNPKTRIRDQSMMGRFRYAKKHSAMWHWPCAKMANLFFGVTVAVLYPAMLTWFEWYWWFVAVIVLSAFPAYFVFYYSPLTKKHPTKMSKARAKYTRSNEPFRYVKDLPNEDNGSYKYQRKKTKKSTKKTTKKKPKKKK